MARISRQLITRGRRKGQLADTKFVATLEGGPELMRKLQELDEAVRVKAAKEALMAAGQIIAGAWADRVPVLDQNYRNAMEQPSAVKVAKTKSGASGSIGVRTLAGIEDDQQPYLYAPRLEYGDADRAAEPSARPAFDATSGQAVDAAEDILRRAAEGTAR